MDFLSLPDLRLAIGSDHAGFKLKSAVLTYLRSQQFEVYDFGCFSEAAVDYPDVAVQVARAIAAQQFSAGILICGTGIGMSIVANKIKGIRAALCTTLVMAELSRRHNDANILCLGGRILSDEIAIELVKIWLRTPFDGGRHQNRITKIHELTDKR